VPGDVAAYGEPASPLDPEERFRLRLALGLEQSSEDGVRRRDPAQLAGAEPGDETAFVLIDLERKIDKLLDSAQAIDQLTAQVRALNDTVIHLERKLIGLS